MELLKKKFKNDANEMIKLAYEYGLDKFFVKVAINEFDFFNQFSSNGMYLEEMLKKYKIKERGLRVLIPVLLSLKLLKFKKGKFYLTSLSKEFLLKSSEKYMGDFATWAYNYNQYKELVSAIKGMLRKDSVAKTTKQGDWVHSLGNKDFSLSFMKTMDQRGLYLASEVTKNLKLRKYKCLLDVGGNYGINSGFIYEKFKKLKVSILEIPSMISITKEMLSKRKLDKKIDVIGGDMFNFESKQKYDVYFYSNVLHDWNYEEIEGLIKKTYKELPKKGKIIIHDGHLNYGINDKGLIANNLAISLFTKGRYYFYDEIINLLKKSGFRKIRIQKIVAGRSLISAIK